MISDSHRFVPQADIVPLEKLQSASATVIGVGAIGRQVAVQLASIGVPRLQLIDFDVVEDHNVTTQGFFWVDARTQLPKVRATHGLIEKIDPSIDVSTITDRYRSRYRVCRAVFCCVDSIAARTAIWRTVANRSSFWADGRMLGEVIRVLAVTSQPDRDYYQSTLFAPSEAQRGQCTLRSTIYAASIAAGLMVHQYTRFLRKLDVDRDISVNLLAGELTCR